MLRKKWEQLHEDFGFSYNAWNPEIEVDERNPLRMMIMNTKRKGMVGVFIGFASGKAVLRLDDGTEVRVPYKNIEMVDANGEAIIDIPTDVLRQPVSVGSLICYSVSTTYSHDFEIGRVTSISEIGLFSVRILVSSGQVLEKDSRWNTKSGIKPHHCLKLPVDEALLTMAVMTDFESILDDHNG